MFKLLKLDDLQRLIRMYCIKQYPIIYQAIKLATKK